MLSGVSIVVRVAAELVAWIALAFRSRQSLQAEVLFLRRQLALYVERGVKPRRIDAATRVSLALLSRFFAWRPALVVVRPQTLIRWHRAGFRLFWKWKSRLGRPPIPVELRELIRRMALENPLWGQERIANELLVKLGIQVSPRTVRKYLHQATGAGAAWRSALVDVPEEPCAGGRGVRLLRRRHQHLSAPICPGDGTWQPTADSLQCDGPSDGGLDAAAVARGVRV